MKEPCVKAINKSLVFRLLLLFCLFSRGGKCNVENATVKPGSQNLQPEGQQFFLNEIFRKYGNNRSMNFEGFEHLLFNLGLGGLVIDDHNLSDHKNYQNSESFALNHQNHDHGIPSTEELRQLDRTVRRAQNVKLESSVTGFENVVEKENLLTLDNPETFDKECLSPLNLLKAFNIQKDVNITFSNFLYLCPAIVYELDERHCVKQESAPASHVHTPEDLSKNKHGGADKSGNVWLYSCMAILVISLCGLLSVGGIPLMHKSFYDQLLQFLVALAVGTLTGDALLHLIPHALSPDNHETENEDVSSVWKGMMVLSGIYFFFIMERIIMIITATCRKHKGAVALSPEKQKNIGEKLSGHQKHDSYGYSHADPNVQLQLLNVKTDPAAGQSDDSLSDIFAKKKEFEANGNKVAESQFHSSSVVTIVDKVPSHSHGHSHEVPTSISAVAYMVIMGDGLHNFTDGLAIGAAFAASITVGLSTSIAVFCHELPHELGDFAVLLKSGMTTRQALFYNFMSSICCFVGMLIGVSLGNIESASIWIFAAAAGMFIYISLVDMVPQLSSDSENPKISNVLLQGAGIFSGIGLMLLIALYEEDLKKAMNS